MTELAIRLKLSRIGNVMYQSFKLKYIFEPDLDKCTTFPDLKFYRSLIKTPVI